MSVNIENIGNCPKCKARLLVFTYEGPDQYLSCVKCSWKILAEKKAGVIAVIAVIGEMASTAPDMPVYC